MVIGIVIPVDEGQPIFRREFKHLSEYQEAVHGYIESIDLDSMNASFYVNGEGKIDGLPVNRRATLLWWLASPQMRLRDAISGDACLIGLPDHRGVSQAVPDELATLLLDTKYYRTEFQTADSKGVFNGNALTYQDFWDAANAALLKMERWAAVERVRVVPD